MAFVAAEPLHGVLASRLSLLSLEMCPSRILYSAQQLCCNQRWRTAVSSQAQKPPPPSIP